MQPVQTLKRELYPTSVYERPRGLMIWATETTLLIMASLVGDVAVVHKAAAEETNASSVGGQVISLTTVLTLQVVGVVVAVEEAPAGAHGQGEAHAKKRAASQLPMISSRDSLSPISCL
jgi:hypothetical protein